MSPTSNKKLIKRKTNLNIDASTSALSRKNRESDRDFLAHRSIYIPHRDHGVNESPHESIGGSNFSFVAANLGNSSTQNNF
jgi:hypothetical protein